MTFLSPDAFVIISIVVLLFLLIRMSFSRLAASGTRFTNAILPSPGVLLKIGMLRDRMLHGYHGNSYAW